MASIFDNNFDAYLASQKTPYQDALEKQSMAKNVDFSKDTLQEQMPEANPIGVGGETAATAAATNWSPYLTAGKLALDVVNQAYNVKNQNLMNKYQAKLQEFNTRQQNLRNLAKPMGV